MENNIWVQIFTNPAVVTVLVGIIGTVLGYLAVQLKKWLDSVMGKEKLDKALTYAEIVCSYVEQIAKQAGWDSDQKFKEALDKIRAWAAKNGVVYTDVEWKMIIERTVAMLSGVWDDFKTGCDSTPKEGDPTSNPTPDKTTTETPAP